MNKNFNRHSFDDDEKRSFRHGPWMWPIYLFILFWIFIPPKVQTVSVYRMVCPDVLATTDTCSTAKIPAKTDYRVFINEQYVVHRNLLKAYDDCDIYNKRNWECRTPQMIITMKNGKELFSARPEGYTSQQLQLEAGQTLLNEEKRSPQLPPWKWYVELGKYWINNLAGSKK